MSSSCLCKSLCMSCDSSVIATHGNALSGKLSLVVTCTSTRLTACMCMQSPENCAPYIKAVTACQFSSAANMHNALMVTPQLHKQLACVALVADVNIHPS